MRNSKEMVLSTSDEAAKYRTGIEGWVSRKGNFYGNSPNSEEIARYDGCTHRPCKECGKPTLKEYLYCRKCTEIRNLKKFESLEIKIWDGITPLYSDTEDEYFCDEDSLEGYMHDNLVTFEDLRLIICEPNYLRHVEEDYVADVVYEDCELSEEVSRALNNLNKVISAAEPIGWSPGKFRAVLEETNNK